MQLTATAIDHNGDFGESQGHKIKIRECGRYDERVVRKLI